MRNRVPYDDIVMKVYGVKYDLHLQGATSCLWDVYNLYRSPNSNMDNDVKNNTTLQKANSSGYSTLDLIFTNESGMLDSLKYLVPIGKSHHSSLKMDFCCYTKASNTSKDRHIYDKGDYDRMREMMRSRD